MGKHHINKVVLDFSFSQKDKEFALRKAKDIFYNKTISHITTVFDTTEKNIYVDKLEIDVGKTTEEEFLEKFSAALSQAFSKLVSQAASETKHESKAATAPDRETRLHVDELVFFLNSGYWPWRIQLKEEEEIWDLTGAFLQESELVVSLLGKISADTTIPLQRLIAMASYTQKLQQALFEALLVIHPYLKEVNSFFQKIYLKAIAGDEGLSAAFVYKLFRHDRLETYTDFRKYVSELLDHDMIRNIQVSSQQQLAISKIRRLLLQEGQKLKEKLLPLLEKFFSTGILLPAEVEFITPSSSPFFLPDDESKISILNAGLILLHPYLPYLFNELGWLDEKKKFIDKQAQQKAVLFLQFLITGKKRTSEHLLVLNKILCGWPIELPLSVKKYTFSSEEKKAGEEMLDALIEHWSILRNTSRNGLIESFIKRKGLVQKGEKSFTLQVERNSIDILLDSLPFGILIIKLPWNEYIINTEWTY